ncbi:MAG TPA: protein phosphatase 2C domain-containing protein [Gemmatales bacterium]|nr:protein phosphatase 2C domain-containing protein [Gemmatales bacterium]HMP59114.1 protein phosphatase 2C domain-containing protein [Gemmatales bacterium]
MPEGAGDELAPRFHHDLDPGGPGGGPAPERAAEEPGEPEADPIGAADLQGVPSTVEIPAYRPIRGPETAADLPHADTAESPVIKFCAVCSAPRRGQSEYCSDCGWMYATPPQAATSTSRELLEPYDLVSELPSRPGLQRWLARRRDAPRSDPVMLVLGPTGQVRPEDETPAESEADDVHGEPLLESREIATVVLKGSGGVVCWPSLAWLHAIHSDSQHPAMPRIRAEVVAEESGLLVYEIPVGRTLWDAWDDPDTTMAQRCSWLIELAEMLHLLHQAGAVFEGFRPELLVVEDSGQVRVVDATDLLPLPLPTGIPVEATPYSAPEYTLYPEHADARADLYSFGAVLYSLFLGRELTEMDFELQGVPKPFVQLFPDAHPLFTRLLLKTLARDLSQRFPTEDGYVEDPSGFVELIRALQQAATVLDRVRLEVASWTSTGIVRSSNEDAFAVLHAASGRQDSFHDCALVLLADGMGGCAAGEVASAMAIDYLRSNLLQEAPFLHVTNSPLATDEVFPPERVLDLMTQAMQEANQAIYAAARAPGQHRRGMGCTAEAVFIQGNDLLAAHIGDSRVYIYSQGRLEQVSRDQTFVQRLVDLGQITEEEAQFHPRRNELQQALGGLPVVDPLTYHRRLQPGDVVLVCSDGLTTHVDQEALRQIIERAPHAESIARRLINFANHLGGVDNTTVVVVRVQ